LVGRTGQIQPWRKHPRRLRSLSGRKQSNHMFKGTL
jgi:hypothetical protein